MKKIVITVFVCLLVFVAYFLLVEFFYPNMETRAQFGDMFGGLNTLFSGLAFLGVMFGGFF